MENRNVQSLILENLDSLRRFAYSLTQDLSDADDLVQIVIEKLLKKLLVDEDNPVPWMFKVCRNAWIDEIRSRKVRQIDKVIDINELSAKTNYKNDFDADLQRRDLMRAIEALPEAFCIVIKLIVVSELSYAEVGQVLGIPIGTVMSRAARARERLAANLRKASEE